MSLPESTEVRSNYVAPDKTRTSELPAYGPRDVQAQIEAEKMAEKTIYDQIILTLEKAGEPLNAVEIYEAAGFVFDRKQMSNKMLRLLESGRVTREQVDGIYKYAAVKNPAKAPAKAPKANPDPLLEKIAKIRFGIPDADLHSKRLKALAEVIQDEEISAYLTELAGIIR